MRIKGAAEKIFRFNRNAEEVMRIVVICASQ